MTLAEWLQTWIDLYVTPADLAENTKKCYTRSVRALVLSPLAAMPLEAVTVFDLRRWLLQVAQQHPRAAQLDRVMLLQALRIAYKAGMAPQSLCDPELLPEITHKPAKAAVLTQEQLRAYLLAACADSGTLALALMALGLRRSEALGVRWEAVDLAAGTLAVVGQRLPGQDTLSPCKTDASVRIVALPEQLRAALRRAPRPISGGWVCPVSHRHVYRLHAALLQRLSLPKVTLHGLRHSFASAAVMGGTPIKLLQGALGHASYKITADLYADHLPEVSAVSYRVFSA